jgi:hypothetical protein
VNDLEKNSGLIHSINDTFRHYHAEVQLWSFYETQKSSVVVTDVMIVDKSSATLGYANERTALLNADHRGVVKFDLPSDPNYKTLRNAFSSTVDLIVQKGEHRYICLFPAQYLVFDYQAYNNTMGPPCCAKLSLGSLLA